ncbi:GTP 3',8-cyclase MoaA [Robiginitomaculum antarcticum]|uniref:GTP 3',8-cyclase MoaA n=1 Tax=Robiginitomaculum antarcticum TaxID=437507 RepID=UPI00047640F3
MVDPFGRTVTYLRLSVTDRCDLRCTYCMPERMTFLPKEDLLSFEELDEIATAFITRGVTKLRITGGEPLVRKDIFQLINSLSRHLKSGALDEMTLTTNATQLARHAQALWDAGIRRINVSIDSLNPETFARVTRGGDLSKVLSGIRAAQAVGLKIKLNCVALKHENASEVSDMMRWAHHRGIDMTLIEAMPMGDSGEDRFDQYVALAQIRADLEKQLSLSPSPHKTGGPAHYYDVAQTGGRLGFITPMSHKFCASCNRVRLTCTGKLFMCLGQDDESDLRAVIRGERDVTLNEAIDAAIGRKPEAHDFKIDAPGQAPSVSRHMSVTGG